MILYGNVTLRAASSGTVDDKHEWRSQRGAAGQGNEEDASMAEMGPNRAWLVSSHLRGTAARDDLTPEERIEQLLVYKEQLHAELVDVDQRLRHLARQIR